MPTRKVPDQFLVAFSFAGEQRDFVRSVAEAVESQIGTPSVFFDEWFEHYIAGADADLKLQQIYLERSVLVVVCVSERYGGKPWTLAEHEAIRERVMKARATTDEGDDLGILPIRVGDGDVKGIRFNTIVPDFRNRTAVAAAQLIVDRLDLIRPGSSGEEPPALDWPEEPPAVRWPVADHTPVRAAFEKLLTRSAPWRFLPVRGPSESGKSHITRQMLGNALRMPSLACGRFDFKGTTDMDAELRSFVQHLEVDLPPAGSPLKESLGRILEAVKRRARPTLLIFDTYEAAGDGRDWVEKQLLPGLVRATWLRVVITGQRVPKLAGTIWEADSCPLIELTLPPPSDWFEYGRRHNPDLALADVEAACRLTDKATVLAQLLGPKS